MCTFNDVLRYCYFLEEFKFVLQYITAVCYTLITFLAYFSFMGFFMNNLQIPSENFDYRMHFFVLHFDFDKFTFIFR